MKLPSRPVKTPSMLPARRRIALGLSLGLVLTGCGWGGDRQGRSPEQTAGDLAHFLSVGHIWGDLPLTEASESAALDYPALINSAEGAWPTVTVVEVDPHSWASTRTAAKLAWSWDLVPGGDPWTYSTRVDLVHEDGTWRADVGSRQFHPELGPGQRFVVDQSIGERGEIIDRDGLKIMTERPVAEVGIDKPSVDADAQDDSARQLAALVGVDPDRYATRVAAAGPKAFVSAITLREDAVDTDLQRDVSEIRGGRVIDTMAQLAPTRDFARPLLGTVGPATQELIEESKGRIKAGEQVGLSGLSRRYDDSLRGTGLTSVEVNDTTVWTNERADGADLQLTLDSTMQQRAEELIASRETATALVAIKPSTQEVLVLATNSAGGGESLASIGRFPPGSTFKIVTLLALLRQGMSPDDAVECPPEITIDGRTTGNYSDYPSSAEGTITLAEAFAHSCNTALMGLADRVSSDDLQQAAQSLGLNHDADLGYPFWTGDVPPTEDELGRAVSMIGQGQVLASPLGMTSVIASVSAGERVTPELIMDVEHPAVTPPPVPLTAEEADTLRSLLRQVVTDGSGSVLDELPGTVLAKTGTAEHGSDPVGTHAWMVAAEGDLAVGVFVADGSSGSSDAGPLVRDFLASR